MTQAGLAGSGFFVITVLAGELAGRLAREEMSARGSMEMARQQAQLNRLVIEEMEDGVLVVDRGGKVRAANPAARRLLAPEGMSRTAPFQLRGVPAWGALVEGGRARVRRGGVAGSGARRRPRSSRPTCAARCAIRVRFTRRREASASEEFCVLFLDDIRNVQARSRQEKLAAMGRVSAGIAHEIRNPLAAIAQANALLSEDATDPSQRQLMRMVTDNVERLKRIVDDVMEVAPGQVAGRRRHRRHGARRRRSAPSGRRRPAIAPGRGERARARACRRSRSACASMPSICAACSSTCSTTRAAMRAGEPARCWCGWTRRDDAGAPSARAERRRADPGRGRIAICSSRFSRPAAAARASAFTFAANSARDTAPASTTACCRPTSRDETSSSSTCAAPRSATAEASLPPDAHDHRLALQPAGRRRRARSAHALRADAAARGLRPRHRRRRCRRRCCT